MEHTTVLTVPRQKLIDALKAKAEANQDAYDKEKAEFDADGASPILKKLDELTGYGTKTFYSSGLNFNKAMLLELLGQLGVKGKTPPRKPELYTRQIAQLEIATDDTLQFAVTDPILNCLG